MFNLLGSRHRTCDGVNRRDFLTVGALGAMGGMSMMTLPQLLRARETALAQGNSTRDASVVWLWLSGGPTHVETFDPKMTAPEEFRSTVGAVQTNVPGIEIGGLFPQMAQVADKMAFVRSFAHGNSSHGSATQWVMTGYPTNPNRTNPSAGSVLARVRGANHPVTGMPSYIKMGNIGGDGAGWLGVAYEPFSTSGDARNNMNLSTSVDQLQDRRTLNSAFDSIDRDVDASGLMEGLDEFNQQAFQLIQGNARHAFDVTREDPRTRDLYGRGLGEQMLLARRLCEAGCGFVTINYGGWDMHNRIADRLRSKCPSVDRAVSAFIQDTVARGLDRNILLVITGEFGRTPRVNRNAGRDHWGPLVTLALAGGGLRMGQVVGESTSNAERPMSSPYNPTDLKATVLHTLGLPSDLQITNQQGRPIYMLDGGRPIPELV